ncbi:MAG: hypothetical protein BWY14_00165 [Parcubacteria group bacterium ADurb.Bin192]|nr:MAG: hypothetical protein BWY14_00165 [Parcubacteria group bacterium ADurb.Bin192]
MGHPCPVHMEIHRMDCLVPSRFSSGNRNQKSKSKIQRVLDVQPTKATLHYEVYADLGADARNGTSQQSS